VDKKLDTKALDKIIKQTVAAVERGKSQIFDIYEAARGEMENIAKDVNEIKQQAAAIIFKVDELERKERRSRLRLMEVSRNFHVYSEEDVKSTYEEASQLQVDLAVAREQEQNLRRQRNDLEQRLKVLKETVAKAENLVTQVGSALAVMGTQMEHVLVHVESMQQRQLFGAKIIKAQEEERRRVAREIHDGPAQTMANIVFRAEVCERLIETDLGRSKTELQDLREQVRFCLKEVRKIIFDLRPMTLDDLGLVPTIRRTLDTLKERTGVAVDLRVIGEDKRLDSHVEISFFRIIQEALTNIEKHAKASSVIVRIEFMLKAVSAVVEDDGEGFDTAESVGSESFGLMGMWERMSLLNGEISLTSKKGKGTKVTFKVPL
jgi:two-component system sensor histidine kinase DegS